MELSSAGAPPVSSLMTIQEPLRTHSERFGGHQECWSLCQTFSCVPAPKVWQRREAKSWKPPGGSGWTGGGTVRGKRRNSPPWGARQSNAGVQSSKLGLGNFRSNFHLHSKSLIYALGRTFTLPVSHLSSRENNFPFILLAVAGIFVKCTLPRGRWGLWVSPK